KGSCVLRPSVDQDTMPASNAANVGSTKKYQYEPRCALGQFVCALDQDCLRRRAYTSASPSTARVERQCGSTSAKSFARLSGYEMSADHQPNGGYKIVCFAARFCFRPRRIA